VTWEIEYTDEFGEWFDPRRTAILLLGGDKSGQWSKWYKRQVPEADRLYDIYLAELRDEGLIREDAPNFEVD
jgi:hypothetical protein